MSFMTYLIDFLYKTNLKLDNKYYFKFHRINSKMNHRDFMTYLIDFYTKQI